MQNNRGDDGDSKADIKAETKTQQPDTTEPKFKEPAAAPFEAFWTTQPIETLCDAVRNGDPQAYVMLTERLTQNFPEDKAPLTRYREALINKKKESKDTFTTQENTLLGILYRYYKQYAEAKECFTQSANGNDPNAHLMLAKMYKDKLLQDIDPNTVDHTIRHHYEMAAAAGSIIAINNIGVAYMTGQLGFAKNPTLALMEYVHADDRGSAVAAYNLGLNHKIGIRQSPADAKNVQYLLPPDEKKAFECFRRSAARGVTGGLQELAGCYENGIGVKRDHEEAARLFELAAKYDQRCESLTEFHAFWTKPLTTIMDEYESSMDHLRAVDLEMRIEAKNDNDLQAMKQRMKQLEEQERNGDITKGGQLLLGVLYFLNKDYQKSKDLFSQIDHIDAKYYLARIKYLETDDSTIAEKYKKIIAEQPHPGALYELAMIHYRKKELNLAIPLLQQAIELGHPNASASLAVCYEFAPPTQDQAATLREQVNLYREAIKKGSTAGLTNLALLYGKQKMGDLDYIEENRLYRHGIQCGNRRSAFNLAHNLSHGIGVSKDYQEAIRLFQWTAKGNDVNCARDSLNHLGLMYDSYDYYADFKPKDHAVAARYYRQAIKKGNTSSIDHLKELSEREVATKSPNPEVIYHAALCLSQQPMLDALNKFADSKPEEFLSLIDRFDSWDKVKPLLNKPIVQKIEPLIKERQFASQYELTKHKIKLPPLAMQTIGSLLFGRDNKDNKTPTKTFNEKIKRDVAIAANKKNIDQCIQQLLGADDKKGDEKNAVPSIKNPHLELLHHLQALPLAAFGKDTIVTKALNEYRSRLKQKEASGLSTAEQIVLGLLCFVPPSEIAFREGERYLVLAADRHDDRAFKLLEEIYKNEIKRLINTIKKNNLSLDVPMLLYQRFKALLNSESELGYKLLRQHESELEKKEPLTSQEIILLRVLYQVHGTHEYNQKAEALVRTMSHDPQAEACLQPLNQKILFEQLNVKIEVAKNDVLQAKPMAEVKLVTQLQELSKLDFERAMKQIDDTCKQLEQKSPLPTSPEKNSEQVLLGICYLARAKNEADYRKAATHFAKIADQYPKDPRAWYFMAQIYKGGKAFPKNPKMLQHCLGQAIKCGHPLAADLNKEMAKLLQPASSARMYSPSHSKQKTKTGTKESKRHNHRT